MSEMFTMLTAAVGVLFFAAGWVKVLEWRNRVAVEPPPRGKDLARAVPAEANHSHKWVYLVMYAPAVFMAYIPGPDALGTPPETSERG